MLLTQKLQLILQVCVYRWLGYVCNCLVYKNWFVQKLHEGWCGCGMSWMRS